MTKKFDFVMIEMLKGGIYVVDKTLVAVGV